MSDTLRATVIKGVFEMVLVSIGVFLGLAADQWRLDRQRREEAIEALRRFKVEIENNRAAVANVADYHARVHQDLIRYFTPERTQPVQLDIQGIRPVNFEHTAWDLAIATQWLAEIDPAIAFELTRLYGAQQTYSGLSSGMLQAMYLRPPEAGWVPFLQSLKVYYDDIVGLEPQLLKMYGTVLPLIDAALRD
jgi:hypothetical protein